MKLYLLGVKCRQTALIIIHFVFMKQLPEVTQIHSRDSTYSSMMKYFLVRTHNDLYFLSCSFSTGVSHLDIHFGNPPLFEILLQVHVRNCLTLLNRFGEQTPLSITLLHDVPGLIDVSNQYNEGELSTGQVTTTICVNINSTFIPRAGDIPQLIFLYSLGDQHGEVDFAIPSVMICPCGPNGYCDYSSTLQGSPTVLDCVCDSLPGKQ